MRALLFFPGQQTPYPVNSHASIPTPSMRRCSRRYTESPGTFPFLYPTFTAGNSALWKRPVGQRFLVLVIDGIIITTCPGLLSVYTIVDIFKMLMRYLIANLRPCTRIPPVVTVSFGVVRSAPARSHSFSPSGSLKAAQRKRQCSPKPSR
ncbi:uncharacterized protein BDV14DRAFT_163299 [Aspergillus stella-maris]|uniref:uncharacterized protein n=1 Tax=Aspergillus stella-maris TaxID=1810926 RepID=UPI003CCDF28D